MHKIRIFKLLFIFVLPLFSLGCMDSCGADNKFNKKNRDKTSKSKPKRQNSSQTSGPGASKPGDSQKSGGNGGSDSGQSGNNNNSNTNNQNSNYITQAHKDLRQAADNSNTQDIDKIFNQLDSTQQEKVVGTMHRNFFKAIYSNATPATQKKLRNIRVQSRFQELCANRDNNNPVGAHEIDLWVFEGLISTGSIAGKISISANDRMEAYSGPLLLAHYKIDEKATEDLTNREKKNRFSEIINKVVDHVGDKKIVANHLRQKHNGRSAAAILAEKFGLTGNDNSDQGLENELLFELGLKYPTTTEIRAVLKDSLNPSSGPRPPEVIKKWFAHSDTQTCTDLALGKNSDPSLVPQLAKQSSDPGTSLALQSLIGNMFLDNNNKEKNSKNLRNILLDKSSGQNSPWEDILTNLKKTTNKKNQKNLLQIIADLFAANVIEKNTLTTENWKVITDILNSQKEFRFSEIRKHFIAQSSLEEFAEALVNACNSYEIVDRWMNSWLTNLIEKNQLGDIKILHSKISDNTKQKYFRSSVLKKIFNTDLKKHNKDIYEVLTLAGFFEKEFYDKNYIIKINKKEIDIPLIQAIIATAEKNRKIHINSGLLKHFQIFVSKLKTKFLKNIYESQLKQKVINNQSWTDYYANKSALPNTLINILLGLESVTHESYYRLFDEAEKIPELFHYRGTNCDITDILVKINKELFKLPDLEKNLTHPSNSEQNIIHTWALLPPGDGRHSPSQLMLMQKLNKKIDSKILNELLQQKYQGKTPLETLLSQNGCSDYLRYLNEEIYFMLERNPQLDKINKTNQDQLINILFSQSSSYREFSLPYRANFIIKIICENGNDDLKSSLAKKLTEIDKIHKDILVDVKEYLQKELDASLYQDFLNKL